MPFDLVLYANQLTVLSLIQDIKVRQNISIMMRLRLSSSNFKSTEEIGYRLGGTVGPTCVLLGVTNNYCLQKMKQCLQSPLKFFILCAKNR